jgi:hypothetical protein
LYKFLRNPDGGNGPTLKNSFTLLRNKESTRSSGGNWRSATDLDTTNIGAMGDTARAISNAEWY